MPIVMADGIATRYETLGAGPPLLMCSPGGFNATLDNWRSLGIYARTRMLEHLSRHFTCILFDRREAGQSGGRLERITWAHYAAQARGLLDHLSIERTHVLGGCLGCSSALAFAAAHPARVQRLVLYWPAGGAPYRLHTQLRFAQHLAFVRQHGLAAVVTLASQSACTFGSEARAGPWASLLRSDPEWTRLFVAQDVERYLALVAGMSRCLFDRDTVVGSEPEDLMQLAMPALIIPGRDASHATSAARYLEECLPAAQYWDTAVSDQTEERVAARLREFLGVAPD